MRTSTLLIAGSLCLAACSSESSAENPENGVSLPDGSTPIVADGATSESDGRSTSPAADARDSSPESATPTIDGSSPDADGAAPSADAAEASVGPMVDRTDPKLHEFVIDPKDLDPTVADSLDDEYAEIDTRTAPLGKLVIFLGGHTNPPIAWRDHGRELARYGFHAILPAYNNRWDTCSGPDCDRNTRWEALTGEDVSTAIVASRADSAEGRVIAILQHLVTADAGGDWGYYLDGEMLRYERIIIAGISHGAASTGVYASRRGFFRAVMHSGGWGSPGNNPSTPVSEWYGFAHTGDDSFDPIVASWDDAGMTGPRTSIDGAMPPYGGTHELITSAATDYPHGSVAVHTSSPKNADGTYVFEPAWRYLYGVAELAH